MKRRSSNILANNPQPIGLISRLNHEDRIAFPQAALFADLKAAIVATATPCEATSKRDLLPQSNSGTMSKDCNAGNVHHQDVAALAGRFRDSGDRGTRGTGTDVGGLSDRPGLPRADGAHVRRLVVSSPGRLHLLCTRTDMATASRELLVLTPESL
jgi:hypothetical protein